MDACEGQGGAHEHRRPVGQLEGQDRHRWKAEYFESLAFDGMMSAPGNRAECQGKVRMGAPRRKLRGAFVFLIFAFVVSAWAGPPLRKDDRGLLGEATSLVPEPRPSNEPEIKLSAGQAVKIVRPGEDRVLVEANGSRGWIPASSIRYARMSTVRGSGLVVMPE